MNSLSENVLTLVERVDRTPSAVPTLLRVVLVSISATGRLLVRSSSGDELLCDWLDTGVAPNLQSGDLLLALLGEVGESGLVLGKVGSYLRPVPPQHLILEAAQSLTLKCGEASIDLRADGKVMIRGEDVLVRAKGTQRIRAGTVSIN